MAKKKVAYSGLSYTQGLPSKIQGVGVFARCFIPKGRTIQIPICGMTDGMNNSHSPNIEYHPTDHWSVIAVKDIYKGDELTMGYTGRNNNVSKREQDAIIKSQGGCNCEVCRK